MKLLLIKQLKAAITWSTVVTALNMQAQKIKTIHRNGGLVIPSGPTLPLPFWLPVQRGSSPHYNKEKQTSNTPQFMHVYKSMIVPTARLTKQHHLINDFANTKHLGKKKKKNNVQTKYKDKASLGQKDKHVNLLYGYTVTEYKFNCI